MAKRYVSLMLRRLDGVSSEGLDWILGDVAGLLGGLYTLRLHKPSPLQPGVGAWLRSLSHVYAHIYSIIRPSEPARNIPLCATTNISKPRCHPPPSSGVLLMPLGNRQSPTVR